MKDSNSREFPIPASVYRLQLNSDFPITKARKVLPYLKALGVEAVYCSPYYKAYSAHGYDVTDPNAFNPLLGSLKDYKDFCRDLKKLGLMHIADVVPNHMGIKGGENAWWQDVMENGPYSEYAAFFDINWSPEGRALQDRVLLPILGNSYAKALANQDIKLFYEEGRFYLRCYQEYILPIAPHSYALILSHDIEKLKEVFSEEHSEWILYQELLELYRFFPVPTQERQNKKEEAREKLEMLFKRSRKIRAHILQNVLIFNGKKKKVSSFNLLDKLLEAQFYRLSFWRVASHEINYRRFFNVNELVSLRIEEEIVLQSHHRWVFELIQKQQIQGIRIDHPDGLYDPITYFQRLRKQAQIYTITEKILEWKEKLPEEWDVEGTVGYEFLNLLGGIFIKQENDKTFTSIYEDFVGKKMDFDEIVYEAKKLFTDYEMVSDVAALGLKLDKLAETSWEYRDFTQRDLTAALSEVIACFPVYRSYIRPEGGVTKRDYHYIMIAIQKAKRRARFLDSSLFDFIESVLLLKAHIRPDEEPAYRDFVLRFQQLTAPMMAKGLEDTTFYIYNRLISLNEVGGSPPRFGVSLGDFHTHNREKKEKWPYGFLATSSHDTKRSEDVRMRLHVLSEIPERWSLEVRKWSLINSKYRKESIDANVEYFIYQTLLGVWPQTSFKKEGFAGFCERVWQVILKSLREAKLKTSWHNPNHFYEEEVRVFFFAIFEGGNKNRFMKEFLAFHKLIHRYGAWNSLSQVAVKMGAPGVVDIYQGNELLTYRLVDPDNRVPVNFDQRRKILPQLKNMDAEEVFVEEDYSKIKFYVHAQALHFRNVHKDLFLEGEYVPLKTKGVCKDNVIAFLRRFQNKVVIVLAARFYSKLVTSEWDTPLGRHAWGDTEILLPPEWKNMVLEDLFTTKKIHVRKKRGIASLRLAQAFGSLPFAFLYDASQ